MQIRCVVCGERDTHSNETSFAFLGMLRKKNKRKGGKKDFLGIHGDLYGDLFGISNLFESRPSVKGHSLCWLDWGYVLLFPMAVVLLGRAWDIHLFNDGREISDEKSKGEELNLRFCSYR